MVKKIKRLGLTVRQFQDFTPTPGTLSTAMYVSGRHRAVMAKGHFGSDAVGFGLEPECLKRGRLAAVPSWFAAGSAYSTRNCCALPHRPRTGCVGRPGRAGRYLPSSARSTRSPFQPLLRHTHRGRPQRRIDDVGVAIVPDRKTGQPSLQHGSLRQHRQNVGREHVFFEAGVFDQVPVPDGPAAGEAILLVDGGVLSGPQRKQTETEPLVLLGPPPKEGAAPKQRSAPSSRRRSGHPTTQRAENEKAGASV